MAVEALIEVTIADKVATVLPLAKLLAAKGNTVAIGRGVDSDIQVHHPSCSRVHCLIEWKGNKAFVKDLRSTHGSSLQLPDGQRVNLAPNEPVALSSGSILTLGASSRKYHFQNLEGLQDELQSDALSILPSLLASQLQLSESKQSTSRAGEAADKENLQPLRTDTTSVQHDVSDDAKSAEVNTLEDGEIPCHSRPCSASTTACNSVSTSNYSDTSSPSAPQKSWVLVLDTNIFLDAYCFLKLSKLVECARPDVVRIVVPRIALRELDHLNHKPCQDARFRARQVFRFFENQKSYQPNPSAVLHFQGKNEPALDDKSFFEEHAREVAYRCNDDHILECAHHFHMASERDAAAGKLSRMVLITNDRALRVRARNIGLLANNGQEALQHMLRRCRLHKLLAEKSEASTCSAATGPITLDD